MSQSSVSEAERRCIGSLPEELQPYALKALESPQNVLKLTTAESIEYRGRQFEVLASRENSWLQARACDIAALLPAPRSFPHMHKRESIARTLHALVSAIELEGPSGSRTIVDAIRGKEDALALCKKIRLHELLDRFQRIDKDGVECSSILPEKQRISASQVNGWLSIPLDGQPAKIYQDVVFAEMRPRLITNFRIGPIEFANPLDAMESYEALPYRAKPKIQRGEEMDMDADAERAWSQPKARRIPNSSASPRVRDVLTSGSGVQSNVSQAGEKVGAEPPLRAKPGRQLLRDPQRVGHFPVEVEGLRICTKADVKLLADRIIGPSSRPDAQIEHKSILKLARAVTTLMDILHAPQFVQRFHSMGRRIGEQDMDALTESGLAEPITRLWAITTRRGLAKKSVLEAQKGERDNEPQDKVKRKGPEPVAHAEEAQELAQDLLPPSNASARPARPTRDDVFDLLMNARQADWVELEFEDGRRLCGAIIFNEFKGTGRLINLDDEISMDFSVDQIVNVKC